MDKKKMKIAVVSNQNKENISGFEHFIKMLEQEYILEISYILSAPKKKKDIISEVKALHPDLLITVDLAGFEQCTLTDNISYNLLDCKQLHLLFHENLPNEQYLNKQLSIAMFFYCMGNTYYEYLRKQYPNLPYLKILSDQHSETALFAAFQETLRECGGIC